jgi:GntR family transcriptional regulator
LAAHGPDLFAIDKNSSIPIYVQIADRVEALVTVGALAAGDMLPSIRSVAEYLRVDYNTVAKAYTELDRAGVIKTARGVGTHVTGRRDETTLRAGRQAKLHDTLSKVVSDLMGLGYSADEIRQAFEASLDVPEEEIRS